MPSKKKSKVTCVTTSTSLRIIVKKTSVSNKDSNIIKKPNLSIRASVSSKTKFTSKESVCSCEVISTVRSSKGKMTKLTITNKTCVNTNVKNSTFHDRALKNSNFKNNAVGRPHENVPLKGRKTIMQSSSTFTPTHVRCSKNETDILDMISNPKCPLGTFESQKDTLHKPFTFPAPAICSSKKDEVAPFYPKRRKSAESKCECSIPETSANNEDQIESKICEISAAVPFIMNQTISPLSNNKHLDFLNSNFCSAEDNIDGSGMKERLSGQLCVDGGPSETYLPPLTCPQISNNSCIPTNAKKTVKVYKNLKLDIFGGRSTSLEITSSQISVHGLKTILKKFLLFYNCLWLQIGSETIMRRFHRAILLESHSDRMGSISFIGGNVLSDPYLIEQCTWVEVIKVFMPGLQEAVKKHVLNKNFLLTFFLVYVKENKLIVNNPEIFWTNAHYKFPHFGGIASFNQHWWQFLNICLSRKNMMNKDTRKRAIEDKVSIMIQSHWHGYVARKQYKECVSCVFNINRWYESVKLMKQQQSQHFKMKNSVKEIQRFFREGALRRKRNAVLRIQMWYHACLAMRHQRVQYVKLKTAVQKIQTYIRSRKVLRECKVGFLEKRNAILKIQVWYRCTVLMKQERAYYLQLQMCTIKIQTWFRTVMQMRQQEILYLRQRNAAVLIQQKFRALCLSRRQQCKYHIQRNSVMKIQKWDRNTMMQQQRQVRLQNTVEGKEAKKARSNIEMKIQSYICDCSSARRQRMECIKHRIAARNSFESIGKSEYSLVVPGVSKEKAAVRKIEQWYCGHLAKKQAKIVKHLEKGHQHKALEKYATKIQAWWRGHLSREMLKSSHVLGNIVSSKYMLNGRSLRTKYLKALPTFKCFSSHSYAVLLNAVLLIEPAVRLSPKICEEFLLSSHLDTLLLLLEVMNRSLPAENVASVLLKILTHVLRHPLGVHHVMQNERTVTVLVKLTRTWCMKRTEEIFCFLCTAWWLLGQDIKTAQSLKSCKLVTAQLLKFFTKVRTWNTTTLRSSASTPKKSLLPELRPDWCSKRTNRPRMFENGEHAMCEVLKILHVTVS